MRIEVVKAALQDKPILRNLLELYQYDFSEIEGEDVDGPRTVRVSVSRSLLDGIRTASIPGQS